MVNGFYPHLKLIRSSAATFFSRLLICGVPLLLFLVLVSFYFETYNPLQIKTTLFQIGTCFLIFIWLVKILLEGQWPFEWRDLKFFLPFVAFLGYGLFSYFRTPFKALAFEETIQRILYFFLALLTMEAVKNQGDRRRFWRWLMAAFVISIAYGFIQYLDTRFFWAVKGIDPFPWRQIFHPYRIGSVFSNPNFFGDTLIVFSGILLIFQAREKKQAGLFVSIGSVIGLLVLLIDKIVLHWYGGVSPIQIGKWELGAGVLIFLWVFLVLLSFKKMRGGGWISILFSFLIICLYATNSKGVWLGLIGCLFVWVFMRPWKIKKIVFGIVTLIAGSIIFFVSIFLVRRPESTSFRLFTWASTWEMIQTEPWLGSGIGSFKGLYPAYKRLQVFLIEGWSNIETSHAENEYLEIWQNEGLVGLGIFLWILIFSVTCGIQKVRWLYNLGPPHLSPYQKAWLFMKKRESIEIVGVLSALAGVLIHWSIDVSPRFVSSGIWAWILPGFLVGLCKNEGTCIREESFPQRGWVHLTLAFIWAFVFLYLRINFFLNLRFADGWPYSVQVAASALMVGFLLYLLLLLLSPRLDEKAAPVSSRGRMEGKEQPFYLPLTMAGILLVVFLKVGQVFGDHFFANVHHRYGFGFLKNSILWKNPVFDEKVRPFFPYFRRAYDKWGGAAENFELVLKLDPNFLEAPYYLANLLADFGRSNLEASLQARKKGDLKGAEELKRAGEKNWGRALQLYSKIKTKAPHYAQVHFKEGLVLFYRAFYCNLWGERDLSRGFYREALQKFYLYKRLDPVFPQNYYMMADILLLSNQFEEVEKLYHDALFYNEDLANRLKMPPFPERVSEIATVLGKVYLKNANRPGPNIKRGDRIREARECFQKALHYNPQNAEARQAMEKLQNQRKGRI